jgi:hypothetical protein
VPLVESLRINESHRRDVALGRVEMLSARPSLIEGAQSLIESGWTNRAEVERVLGITPSETK